MSEWLIQIFAVSDALAQELIVGLLGGIDDVVATSVIKGADHFVVTECADPDQARSVFRIVTSIDFDASVVRSSNGPIGPFAG